LFPIAAFGSANHPKVLIIFDMEGVSGVTDNDSTDFAHPEKYAVGRQFLTDDVNAAVNGLIAGGAGSILVQDGHGSGNSEGPDILLDRLDPRASFDFRNYPFDPYSTGLDGSIDAIVCVGMHARAGTNGFIAHTDTIGIRYKINDVEFTETHIVALSAARWGIPVIMVSGDDVLESQLKFDFPQMEYATVKIARGHNSAVAFSPPEVSRRIESAARNAMVKFLAGGFHPYYLPPPYNFLLTFGDYLQAENAAIFPGVSRVGESSVQYQTAAFVDGLKTSYILLRLRNYILDRLMRILEHDPGGKKYLDQLRQTVDLDLLDPDKVPDWAKPQPKQASKRLYWGDN